MYSFKMLLDPKLVNGRGGAFAEDYIKILNAKAYYTQTEVDGAVPTWEDVGIKKVDDMTLEITTSIAQDATEVMSHFAYAWTVPVYEEMYEALMNADRTATTYGTEIEKVVCSGAFTYNAWERDCLLYTSCWRDCMQVQPRFSMRENPRGYFLMEGTLFWQQRRRRRIFMCWILLFGRKSMINHIDAGFFTWLLPM